MKYIKHIRLLILMAVALPCFTSCSDDDDVNTRECTIGFESAKVEFLESATGYVNVPIVVKGHRNGPVRMTIEAAPYGDSPAVEGENYTITDKTLNINADTLSTDEINVELKIVNDDEINDNRQFTLTIASVEGAEVTTQTTIVTIIDDDKDPYFGFFGTWYLNGTSASQSGNVNTSVPVTISGANSTTDPAYNRRLTVESANIIGLPISFTMNFNINANDPSNITGTLGIPYGQIVATDVQVGDPVTGEALTISVTLAGVSGNYIDLTGTLNSQMWTIGSDNTLPTEITFARSQILFGFSYTNDSYPEANGFYNFANFSGVTLTREPLY